MSNLRELSGREKALIVALLEGNPATRKLVESVDDLVAQEMTDGGMGSLRLTPKGCEAETRSFGEQVALGEFKDSDGVPVSVALNVDKQGRLFELDVWKVNFMPLLGWPDPGAVKITKERSL